MHVQFRHASNVSGLGRVAANQLIDLSGPVAIRAIASGAAKPRADVDEYLEQLKERARKKGQNVDWEEQERFKNMRPRAVITASSHGYYPPTEESFGVKVKRAAKALAALRSNSRTRHSEQAEQQRARHRPLQRRQRTKGE